jgi:hypothetical protein
VQVPGPVLLAASHYDQLQVNVGLAVCRVSQFRTTGQVSSRCGQKGLESCGLHPTGLKLTSATMDAPSNDRSNGSQQAFASYSAADLCSRTFAEKLDRGRPGHQHLVIAFNAEDILKGATNVADVLCYLLQATFNPKGRNNPEGTIIQLRGLTVGNTLVLISGLRAPTSSNRLLPATLLGVRSAYTLNITPKQNDEPTPHHRPG